MSTFREQFGRELENRRRERGWSVSATVREANRLAGDDGPSFHVTVLQRWEAGTSTPNVEQALWICRALGIPLMELTLPRQPGPWIDGSLETLDELEDLVAGRAYVETIDATTGLWDVVEVIDPEGGIGELLEIPEEVR